MRAANDNAPGHRLVINDILTKALGPDRTGSSAHDLIATIMFFAANYNLRDKPAMELLRDLARVEPQA